ncbi:MAG: UvrD-helicase domain-containing protein, partial [Ruminococcus sp.]|nr:UvrD-helicase domain-containing protein [Ruminococcus sp.]
MNEFNTLKQKAMDKFFEDLNDMQRKAVFKINGPLLILAGAGSGKTTVLINRVANMIYFGDAYSYEDKSEHSAEDIQFLKDYTDGRSDDHSHLAGLVQYNTVNPWNILAITFTNKAAKELKDRLVNMLGEQGENVRAATFHSACARILRAEAERLGYKSSFTIYDTDDSLRLIKSILKELGLSDKIFPPRSVLSLISAQKNNMISPEEYYKANVDDVRDRDLAKMYKLYNERLKEANAMDKYEEVLREVPRVREDFGYPPLVTPSSQIVGTQAVLNVLMGERYKMVPNEAR